MKRLALATLLLLTTWSPNLLAACERTDICEPTPARRYPSLARGIGLTVEHEWLAQHLASLEESFKPGCEAFGQCMSVWGNPVDFCRLLMTVQFREECGKRWDMKSDYPNWRQCRAVADVFSMSQNIPGDRAWVEIQACAAEEAAASGGVKSPRVEIVPPDPPLMNGAQIEVRAWDPDKGYPVYGLVTIGGVQYGPTFQPINYSLRPVMVEDELGRESFRLPEVIVNSSPARDSGAPPYEPVSAAFSTKLAETVVEFDPPMAEWRAGSNHVQVTGRDAATGEVLAGRVMMPGKVLGDSRAPVTIELKNGDELCSDPIWFRPRQANRSDVTFPLPACE